MADDYDLELFGGRFGQSHRKTVGERERTPGPRPGAAASRGFRVRGSCSGMEKFIRRRPGFANLRLHLSIAAQLLEAVLAFLLLAAAGAFAGLGVAEFFGELAYVPGVGFGRG